MATREQVVLVLDTDATRKYPFSRETLDKIQELREHEQRELNEENPGKEYLVPAPVIIKEAIDLLYDSTFAR